MILAVVLLVVAVIGFVLFRMYNEKTPDIVQQKPDVRVAAGELIAAFDRDTAAARKTYLDRIVEVSGPVKRIDTSGAVVLGDEGSLSEVTISLDRRHLNDHRRLKLGALAVLQGVCSGYSKNDSDDLLASLGTTVELRSAGVKQQNEND